MKNPIISYLSKNQFLAAIAIVAGAWLLFNIRGIILGIFISYIIMAALYPAVSFLTRKGISKALAVFFVFLTTLIILTILVFPLIPFFVGQIQSLVTNFPKYLNQLTPILGFAIEPKQVQNIVSNSAGNIGENAISVTGRVFGGFFSVVTILVVSFYLLLEHDTMNKHFLKLFAKENRDEAKNVVLKVEDKLGKWLRGQLVLSFVIGLFTWVALTIAGVDYALPLALMAGLLEIVPTVGPIIAAVPAIIVALSVSPTLALIVGIIYIVLQLLENHVLVPRIMAKAVGLNPLVVLLGIIIGAQLLGVAGALLSVPFISLITVVYDTIKKDPEVNVT